MFAVMDSSSTPLSHRDWAPPDEAAILGGFKWGLTRDYPMVAPNDGENWSALARENNFGRKPAAAAVPIPVPRKTAGRSCKARP